MSSLSESEAREFHSAYLTGFAGFWQRASRALVALYVEALVLRTKNHFTNVKETTYAQTLMLFDPRQVMTELQALLTLALTIHFILLSTDRYNWLGDLNGGGLAVSTHQEAMPPARSQHVLRPLGGPVTTRGEAVR